MPTINSLPPELIVDVTDNLDIFDVAALALTSRGLFAICDRILYHETTKSDFLREVPLGWGAWFGKIGTVRKALAAGSDPNHVFQLPTKQEYPRLPLSSLRSLSLRSLRSLTAHGEDGSDEDGFNSLDREYADDSEFRGQAGWRTMDYTSMHCAARQGHVEIVELLLDHGADINSISRNCCSCDRTLASQLEAFYHQALGGIFERTTQSMATPLHSAMCSGQLATAKFLLERGAAPLSVDDQGRYHVSSPLFLAANLGFVELLRPMLETSNININDVQDAKGLTPLYQACAGQGWNSTVMFLLKHGANINQVVTIEHKNFKVSATILGEACYIGKFRNALRLLDLGADITPGVAVTLRVNHDFEDQDQAGDRPRQPLALLHACCHGPDRMEDPTLPVVVQRLVKAGAPLEGKWGGETALGFAARRCVEPAVRALLDAGADVDSRDTTGKTPLMAAIFQKVYDVGTRPRHPGIFPEVAPVKFHQGRRALLPVAQILLSAKASLAPRDLEGKTALHIFFSGHTTRLSEWSDDIVRPLLRNGADPCARDNQDLSVFVSAFNCKTSSPCSVMLRTHYNKIIHDLTPRDIRAMIKRAMTESESQDARILVNYVLDIDHTRSISSDKQFFLGLFVTPAGEPLHRKPFSAVAFANVLSRVTVSEKYRINMVTANAIFQRGVDDMGLDTQDWTVILCGLLFNASRDHANDFLSAAIKCADLNQFDKTGRTLLYHLLDSPYHLDEFDQSWDSDDPDFPGIECAALVNELINSGANAHLPQQKDLVKLVLSHHGRLETPVQVALEKAITGPSFDPLDYMQILEHLLRQQPIGGNLDAARAKYLHQAVAQILPSFKSIPPVVQVLLDAGADPTELVEWGDTPLSVLMQTND